MGRRRNLRKLKEDGNLIHHQYLIHGTDRSDTMVIHRAPLHRRGHTLINRDRVFCKGYGPIQHLHQCLTKIPMLTVITLYEALVAGTLPWILQVHPAPVGGWEAVWHPTLDRR